MLRVASQNDLSLFASAKGLSPTITNAPFSQVLLSAQAKTAETQDVAQSPNAVAVAALSAAMSQFGITVPPALRITTGTNGLELSGDNRNAKFQAMLQANPALETTLNGMISQQDLARKNALKDVVRDFLGKSASPGMEAFAADFLDDEANDTYSLSFNGASIGVDEMSSKGWQPVKDTKDFRADLLAAYTKYQVTHAVTVEKRKDEDDNAQNLGIKSKLAEALKKDDGAVS
jgi:hypothetical protein